MLQVANNLHGIWADIGMDVSGQEEAMRSFQQAVPRRGEILLKEAENERQALQDRVDSLVAEIRSIHEVAAISGFRCLNSISYPWSLGVGRD